MFYALGQLKPEHKTLLEETFFEAAKKSFYNWDVHFTDVDSSVGATDLKERLVARVRVLRSIKQLKSPPAVDEIHGSIRVRDLANSAKFYTWLLGVEPKEWTHRYVTFYRKETRFNFVLLSAGEAELHHDTLYHLGVGVSSKSRVLEFYQSALDNGFHIEKPPRTTWRGTPLHELWFKDQDGTLIEVYTRLTEEEMQAIPANMQPQFLT